MNKKMVIILLIIYSLLLTLYLTSYNEFILEFIGFLTVLIFFTILLVLGLKYNDKDMKNEKPTKNRTLYGWTDNLEGAHNLANYLLKDIKTSSIIENLEVIKKKLENYCGNDLEKIRLLKAYFDAAATNNYKSLYYKTILTIFIGIVITSLRMLGNTNIEWIPVIFELNPVLLFVIVLYSILLLIEYMNMGKNRNNLICNILEQLIDEKENSMTNVKKVNEYR
ncbi:hypothetical protein RVS70_09370 [Virgibacillus sp. M23]|uniref:hypothetical protein n=1 Tax=Virgibacillus sp. M23 TaxID=3079030 RepID=UPI002A90CD52|nr:hypothetical protein [Virgibacillus sp. M23]MDY7044414.1 hypothetical protein [Virgibacillus sp. M23]